MIKIYKGDIKYIEHWGDQNHDYNIEMTKGDIEQRFPWSIRVFIAPPLGGPAEQSVPRRWGRPTRNDTRRCSPRTGGGRSQASGVSWLVLQAASYESVWLIQSSG